MLTAKSPRPAGRTSPRQPGRTLMQPFMPQTTSAPPLADDEILTVVQPSPHADRGAIAPCRRLSWRRDSWRWRGQGDSGTARMQRKPSELENSKCCLHYIATDKDACHGKASRTGMRRGASNRPGWMHSVAKTFHNLSLCEWPLLGALIPQDRRPSILISSVGYTPVKATDFEIDVRQRRSPCEFRASWPKLTRRAPASFFCRLDSLVRPGV